MNPTRTHRRRGFTLIEVLIVVVILGILAATVLPQFTSANDDAKFSALIQNLQLVRSQIELYKFQHEGRLPGQAADDDALQQSLLNKTTLDGTIDANGEFGPYIIGQLPPNPYNGLRTVKHVDTALSISDADDSTGWLYSRATGEFRANSKTGTTPDGSELLFDQ